MPTGNKHLLYPCHTCGSKFSPQSTGGVCPYCKTANPALVEYARKNAYKMNRRKKQIKKAVLRLSALVICFIAVIVGIVLLFSQLFKGGNDLVYKTEQPNSSPVFYTDSDGRLYYLSGGKSYIVGKGQVSDHVYSEKNKVSYAVFEGSRNFDSTASASTLIKITNGGKNIETVAETYYGSISFVHGGNCEYIYYMVDEILSSYQTPSYLYIYSADEQAPVKIDEFSTDEYFGNFRVSPNGKYLLYKTEDDGGTKLVKYSATKAEKELLGIKNAEPVSIDNKGKCYSYLKKNPENGLATFYVETGVSDREQVSLPSGHASKIYVSSDCRDFVIESGLVTIIKQFGKTQTELLISGEKGFGIEYFDELSYVDPSPLAESGVSNLYHCTNEAFYPYYYVSEASDGSSLMYCDANGDANVLIESGFSQFCTNGDKGAYILQNALYTIELNPKKPKITLASENFGDFKLEGISDNGKYIFCSDENGNLNRIPFKYKGSDWTRMAIDPKVSSVSDDGRRIIYSSDEVLYFSKDDKATKIADAVLSDKTFVTNGMKKILLLARSESSKAENAYTLYSFDGKKLSTVADNVTDLFAPAYLKLGQASPTVYTSPYVPQASQDEAIPEASENPEDIEETADDANTQID